MKAYPVDTIELNERRLRLKTCDGDHYMSDAAAELLGVERAKYDAARRRQRICDAFAMDASLKQKIQDMSF